jgi:hypothetical protein
MSQPQWITRSGSLGVIPEGVFYSIPIQATANGKDVFFKLIAGQLPAGIQITDRGVIAGTPRNILTVQGVPREVSEDITSKFAIRAYTVKDDGIVDRIADQTFTLTVTGQDVPEFVTPPGNIGTFYDGTKVRVPIIFTDDDVDDIVTIRVLSGELPPGLTIDSKTGVISGIIQPLVGPPGTAAAGYDITDYDEFSFDFATLSATKNFQFSLEITDGKDSNVRSFEIFVYAKSDMQASVTTIPADVTTITADVTPVRVPVLINDSGFIGRYRTDNYFAYKFDAIDFDDDAIVYEISVDNVADFEQSPFDDLYGGVFAVPPGLELNPDTGWLSGYLPNQGATELSYRFGIRVKKRPVLAPPWNPTVATYISGDVVSYLGDNYVATTSVLAGVVPTNTNYWQLDPPVASPYSFFTVTLIGDIESEVRWITEPDLGSIDNGSISTLEVKVLPSRNRGVQYRIASGTNSRLPQGLTLQPSGHITGRVSFNTFALDGGTTTFDQESRTFSETTFDIKFEFTVNAFSVEAARSTLSVESINLLDGGSGYNQIIPTFSAPESPGGVTATGIVTLVNGFITDVQLLDPGSGYQNPPTVFFTPPQAGSQAAVRTEIVNGAVTSVIIDSAGSPYNVPEVLIAAPPDLPGATRAVAGNVTIVNGVITNIAVTNPGIGYLSAPEVTIVGNGTGAVATATASDLNRFNAISVFRRFSVKVNRRFDEPYQDLYIKAMPPESDRDILSQLLQNQDIIPVTELYRADDPNFGIARAVRYNHAFGLRAAEIEDYVAAMTINHYWKNLTLGEISWAQALNSAGNPVYEVVYSRVIDPMLNQPGESVRKEILWPVRIDGVRTVVYPNSLINMRDQMFSTVGRTSGLLPAWMTSKQPNGRVLGFTPAWVIAYVKPGEGAKIAYNIQQKFGNQLNLIDFKADRYELDRTGSFAWGTIDDSSESKQWLPFPPESTVFDEDATVFNGRSTKFVTPAFTTTTTDEFDKYLLYPRVNILG